jgi:Cu+-exporting ATPase
MGKSVLLLTGDREGPANNIAQAAGIKAVRHSVSPSEKLDVVLALQRAGSVVCMVGDGVNDAPALAQADVGMSVGSGTDIAKTTSSVTLMRNDLRDIVRAIHISADTMRVIRQNFVFAFMYNVLGIPLAAGVLLPVLGIQLSPMYAAAAMALSSVTVLTNALRLR